MTTQGGVGYSDLIAMEEKELMWWYQKTVDYNDDMNEKADRSKRKR